MTPERFDHVLDIIGWSRRHLAGQLGAGNTTVDQWSKGQASVPDAVATWLEGLAAVHLAMPPPKPAVWNRRQAVSAAA
jgi:ribosome-binding protein aMBF1 (putative translation factor)